ncbi:MAG: hypothetical protein EZS28_042920, partial [Streblomastix strix]
TMEEDNSTQQSANTSNEVEMNELQNSSSDQGVQSNQEQGIQLNNGEIINDSQTQTTTNKQDANKIKQQQIASSSEEQKEVVHRENLEEKHPFILNLFYCFFMPLICRIKPVTADDIYDVAKTDRCDYTTNKADKSWSVKFAQYALEKAEYDKLKEENPDAKLREPSQPSIFIVMLLHIGSIQLLLAIFFMILSVGFQICQPSMMKEVLKAVVIKGMNTMLPPDQQISSGFPYVHAIILMAC